MEGATSIAPVKEIDNQDHQDLIDHLPPGFRFHPTDEEITSHYLTHKVMNASFSARAIGEVDLNKCEPWDLPKKAKMGGKELYFFWKRDKKYPTGTRTNRATDSGYWKATGKDKEIIIKDNKGQKGHLGVVGMKKTLVFYKGRAPKGDKTNWVMHEFRLESKFSYNFNKNEWVVCRVVHKNTGVRRSPSSPITTTGGHENMITRMNSINTSLFKDDDILLLGCPNNNSMPPLMNMDPPNHYSEYYKDRPGGSRFSDIEEEESESKRVRARATDTVGNDEYLRYFSTTMNDQQRLQKKFNLYPDHHPYYHHDIHPATENHPIFPFQAYHDHYLHHHHHQQQQQRNNTTTTTSNSCTSSLVPSFLGRAQPDTAVSYNKNGKLHDNPDEERQSYYCKLEHYLPSCYQSSSMVTSLSQDTTLDVATPTTTTTEISSSLVHVSTKQENNVGIYSKLSYEEEEEDEEILGGAFGPVSDLDILWN